MRASTRLSPPSWFGVAETIVGLGGGGLGVGVSSLEDGRSLQVWCVLVDLFPPERRKLSRLAAASFGGEPPRTTDRQADDRPSETDGQTAAGSWRSRREAFISQQKVTKKKS